MKGKIYGVVRTMILIVPVLSYAQGWFTQNSGTNKTLYDVHFADTQNGWVASQTNTILYTSDGGQTWVDLQPPPSVNYWGIHFVSAQEGYAVGSPGKIRHTTDAGITWTDQSGGSYNNWDVHFIDENNGWIAGGREQQFPSTEPIRYIYHTTDGGDNWHDQIYDFDAPQLWAVHILDGNIGYAVGDGGTIFHTTNGGGNWFEQNSGTLRHLRSVCATSPDTAWAVGVLGTVLKTTNAGVTWDSMYAGTSDHFEDVFFIDMMTGWIVGGENTQGAVLYTSDGGDSWVPQDVGASKFLFAVYFTDADTGWAVGYDGTVIHTTTGGTGIEEVAGFTGSQNGFILAQNRPNPFSGVTSISYSIPQATSVKLTIYDLIGQEVVTLVDGKMPQGRHSINFDGRNLPNGVYFYRLTAGSTTRTRMCLLLK